MKQPPRTCGIILTNNLKNLLSLQNKLKNDKKKLKDTGLNQFFFKESFNGF